MPASYNRIPYELRQRRQWCLSGENKAPLSTNGSSVFNISVLDNTYLLTFQEAVNYSKYFNLDFGYVLSKDDPFTCIDLDVTNHDSQVRKNQTIDKTKWTTQEHMNRYWSIVQSLKSYTEFSKYGKGIHIWVRGKIGAGMRRDGVEVYSQERYIICTGNSLVNLPITENQAVLDNMKLQMCPQATKTGLEEYEEVYTDNEIVTKALSATNSDKYIKLSNGDWQGDYPSQSEADLAFMSMLTFYSKSNEQCRRLFRLSLLGERDKAMKDNRYLNNTLQTIRSREFNDNAIRQSQIEMCAAQVSKIQNIKKQSEFLHTQDNTTDQIYETPIATVFSQLNITEDYDANEVPWPPGMVGTIARYIYYSAPRPVREVAIVASYGLVAGICGKAWTITQSGLNMYIILIAQSGVGKEAMHSGISSLLSAVVNVEPACMQFVNFNDHASGPALIKAVLANNCFVNVTGEWGRKLARLAKDDGKDSGMQSLRTAMTDLYQKSGPTSMVGGLTYSTKENNVNSVEGVAYSMIGETTPGTFFDSLTQSMMSDGFLSRFNLMEYTGKRPPLNPNQIREPDKPLIDWFAQICGQSLSLMNSGETTPVQRNSEAADEIGKFEIECDNNINGSDDEAYRQMWNRASLKFTKKAALLAVADNFIFPVITKEHTDYALREIRAEIALMEKRTKSGDVGINDNSRELKITSLLNDYIFNDQSKGYRIDPKMKSEGVVTRKYLQARIASMTAFEKHPQGSSKALDFTLKSLVDNGVISDVGYVEMNTKYAFSGKGYRVLDLSK